MKRGPPPSTWSKAMERELKQMWAEKISTVEIGRRLGVTKNSVVGKAHRMELPERDSPINIEGSERRRAAEAAAQASLPPSLRESPVDGRKRTGTYLAITPGFDVGRLKGGCRWIDGNDYIAALRAGGDPYCGAAPSGPGSPWCAKHHAIVFTRRMG